MPKQENHSLKSELRHFCGSDQFYRNPLFKGYVYTEGVQHLAEQGECYWLIDYIFSHQLEPQLKAQPFQVWKIHVNEKDQAVFTVEDGNKEQVMQRHLGYADFPFQHFTLWLVDKTLMLPSEY